MSSVFQRRRQKLLALKAMHSVSASVQPHSSEVCKNCGGEVPHRDLVAAGYVCPLCGYHHPIGAYYRLSQILDRGSFRELDEELASADPLDFPGYRQKLTKAQAKTGMNEGVVTALGRIGGTKVAVGVLDSRFFMGSMSAALGEKVTRLVEQAAKSRLPLILFAASGGARMQEGILSLMQMARTTAAINQVKEKGIPYISVLTDPTTGGVSASFAMLGDVHIAEKGCIIGFAGARVIEQTIREKLPEGFQRAEYLREHGMVDIVVTRQELKNELVKVISILTHKKPALNTALLENR